MFYKFSSFVNAGTIYAYDFADPKPAPKIFRDTKISDLDTSLFKVEQVFYPSKDGTKIPMFIIANKVRITPLSFSFFSFKEPTSSFRTWREMEKTRPSCMATVDSRFP
jgi:hypothetical protein